MDHSGPPQKKREEKCTAMPKATLVIDTDAEGLVYSKMIFGGFIEHFGRQIYGGVFDPDSSLSDSNGFRKYVVDALKELKTPVVR